MPLKLGIVELHHPSVFGYDSESTPNIINHFMVYVSFECPGRFSSMKKHNEQLMKRCKAHYRSVKRSIQEHPTIRNYSKYVSDDSSFDIKIFKQEMLPGGEYVGYPIGTFWLKILQRTWKNKYKLLMKRRRFNYLKSREIHGR